MPCMDSSLVIPDMVSGMFGQPNLFRQVQLAASLESLKHLVLQAAGPIDRVEAPT
jgi:hypothetical protein